MNCDEGPCLYEEVLGGGIPASVLGSPVLSIETSAGREATGVAVASTSMGAGPTVDVLASSVSTTDMLVSEVDIGFTISRAGKEGSVIGCSC
jgi:hypothetical protein